MTLWTRFNHPAWLLLTVPLVAGACGNVSADADAGPDRPDARVSDDGHAADQPDAQTTGIVSVTVYNESGSLEQGASVVFHHGDGTVVQKLSTDAHGIASSVVDAGDLVSVVRTTNQGGRQVMTFLGVKPGDQLRSGDPHIRVNASMYGTLMVSGVVYAGASGFSVDAGCFDGAALDENGVATLPLFDGCHDPAGTVPLYVQARDSVGRPLAYATRPALMSGGTGSVAIAASEWRTDFASAVISIVHAPTKVTVYPTVFVDNAPGLEVFEFNPQVAGSPQPGDNVNATVVVPRNLGTGYDHSVEEVVYTGNDQTFRLLAARKTGALPASISIDGARFLPYLTGRAAVGTGDAARPRLTWTSEAALDSVDGGMVHTSWYDPVAQASQEWILVVPPGTTSVQLPALPDSLAAWRPGVDASPEAPALYFVEASAIAGYDFFRQHVGTFIFYQTGRTFLPLMPLGEGDLRVTSIDIAGS